MHAESLRLADIFTDGMVLQRQMTVPVWGWGVPNSAVQVKFGSQNKSAKTDSKGYWRVALDPMEANAQGQTLTVQNEGQSVQIGDTLVGEVWLASGQSNMVNGGPDIPTGVYPFYQSEDDTAAKPEIRFRSVSSGASLQPLDDIDSPWRGQDKWTKLDEPATANWSMSRYFARVLRDTLNVPVGMVLTAAPGTNQTAWMSRETLERFPGQDGKANYYDYFYAEQAKDLAKSKGKIQSWEDFKAVEALWKESGKGRWPGTGLVYVNFPTALYNTRIHPLAPLAFRGVIWHQGEAGPGGPYDERMVAMFSQWRELFGRKFPVLVGTLGRMTTVETPLAPVPGGFYRSGTNASIRKVPELFGAAPAFEYVELYDLGNDDTHFSEKSEAGRRLGFAALDQVYGIDRIYTGPRLVDSKFDGDKLYLKFDHVGDGLRYEPSIDGISGICAKGAGDLCWAEVKVVDATTLVCSLPGGGKINYAAYGIYANPHETLFNSANLPASPFGLNPDKIQIREKAENAMLGFQGLPGGTKLHLEHVRRDGYIFCLRNSKLKGAPAATVSAYVPDEWPVCVVLHEGTAVPFELAKNEAGHQVVRFQIPVDGRRVIVARKGAEAELLKVNRY